MRVLGGPPSCCRRAGILEDKGGRPIGKAYFSEVKKLPKKPGLAPPATTPDVRLEAELLRNQQWPSEPEKVGIPVR